MSQGHKDMISQAFRLHTVRDTGKYPGLPLCVPRSHSQPCKDVLKKVDRRLAGWKARTLSQTSRTVLIQTVAAALPPYFMSVFELPKFVNRAIDMRLKNFW